MKNLEILKAYLDGKPILYRTKKTYFSHADGWSSWDTVPLNDGKWASNIILGYSTMEFRIQPKSDVVYYRPVTAALQPEYKYASIAECRKGPSAIHKLLAVVRVTCDGETGEIKSTEIV